MQQTSPTHANVESTTPSTTQDECPDPGTRCHLVAPEDSDHLEARGLMSLASHIAYIRTLDVALDRIDKLLNIYQPPKSGKIRIQRWKRTKGDESVISPMAVKWIQDRITLRWRGKVVSTFKVSRSAKSVRAFHEHHLRVQRYLTLAQEVLQLRSEAVTRVETFRRAMMLAERVNLPKLLAIGYALGVDLEDAAPVELMRVAEVAKQLRSDD